jgi:hypothetical protein
MNDFVACMYMGISWSLIVSWDEKWRRRGWFSCKGIAINKMVADENGEGLYHRNIRFNRIQEIPSGVFSSLSSLERL